MIDKEKRTSHELELIDLKLVVVRTTKTTIQLQEPSMPGSAIITKRLVEILPNGRFRMPRWLADNKGLIPPGREIPAANKTSTKTITKTMTFDALRSLNDPAIWANELAHSLLINQMVVVPVTVLEVWFKEVLKK